MLCATRPLSPLTRRARQIVQIFLVLFVLAPSAAQARPSSGKNLRADLDRLGSQIAALDEDHNVAKIRLAAVQRDIRENQRSKQLADERAKGLRGAASARAAAVYRSGLPGLLLIFFGSSDQTDFSRRVGAASRVGDWENGLMSKLRIANEVADHKEQDLRESLSKARSIRDDLAQKRAALATRQAQQQRLLDRFVAAAEAAKAAARAASARTTSGRPAAALRFLPGPNIQRDPIPAPANLSASGGARTALQTAYAQTGKPYQWGAEGPGSFDCSGLTMYAWRSAGVSLPHSSRAQYAATKRVDRSDLQPGDLVFFGSPIHHVGIYVGDGKMINSPETGERVGVRSMERRDYAGAGRPGV